jgi:hypothetical protein
VQHALPPINIPGVFHSGFVETTWYLHALYDLIGHETGVVSGRGCFWFVWEIKHASR